MGEREAGQDTAREAVQETSQETSYDYGRYRQLLADAVDEAKRLELIKILIRENARERLQAQRAADQIAMTVRTVARVLGPGGAGNDRA
jgi:hypothetical protein